MSIKTGIIYATVDGQTLKICNRLEKILREQGHLVETCSIEDFAKEVNDFDKIIIASSMRYGKHNARIIDFIERHAKELEEVKSVFISVNLVARKADKNTAATNPYVAKFLNSIDWKPDKTGVFAGKLDYQRYSLVDRWMIRFIMWLTKGPIKSKEAIEFTDWNSVEEFGKEIRSW